MTTLAIRSFLGDVFDHLPAEFQSSSIGYDQVLSNLASAASSVSESTSYPPHNIRQIGESKYVIEVAVAGFSPEEIEVSVEKQVLTIEGTRNQQNVDASSYLHRGLAFRPFRKQIPLVETIEVRSSTLENGLLSIEVENVIPEKERKRIIPLLTK